MSEQTKKNPNQINIDLSEEIADGQYSNLSIITHSATEFVVDFVQLMPGVPKGKVKSRIIMTPENAKKLMYAMKENIEKYESVHGKIKNPQPMGIPLNFGGPTTEA
jgi:hypothetical protein